MVVPLSEPPRPILMVLGRVAFIEMADRILVYGVTGSGKSTLAAQIAEALGRPWTSVDDLTYESNWVPVPDDEQRRRFTEICAGEQWILDTAYGKWIDIPLARVQLIVALDYPRWVSLGRLLKRTFLRARDKKPICNGNVETWSLVFSRESILVWHFRSFKKKRERIRKWEKSADGPETIVFRHPKEAERWLQGLGTMKA